MIFERIQWLSLIDLSLVTISGVFWYNWPELGIWPLALALLPWALRLINGNPPFQRTSFDLLIFVFLITAGIGVWIAYDRSVALAKFWLIVEAVLLYYALARQPAGNLWLVGTGLGLFGSGTAAYFLLTHDWVTIPAKFEVINQIGLRWMELRPELNTDPLHHNVAAGITAMTFPFLVAVVVRARGDQEFIYPMGVILAMGVSLTGMLLSTSRGAILALSATLFIWGLWELSGVRLPESRRKNLFFTILGLLLGFGFVILITYPGGIAALADRLPGPPQGDIRLNLVRGSLDLIEDYPITGSGLNTYPALYSQYILDLPFHTSDHGHNLFLDVTLDQGILGGLTYLGLTLAVFWALSRWKAEGNVLAYLQWAALASLLAMVFHGLVDDVLYGSRAAMLIFLPTGMGVAVTRSGKQLPRPNTRAIKNIGLVLVIAVTALLAVFCRPILANWYANLGALEMNRVELSGWPSGKRDDGSNLEALKPAKALFHRALQEDPQERTSHYRLGLIAMLRQDFTAAVDHLETAHQIDPLHWGVRKNLGYSYVWVGRYASAQELLIPIPEAQSELGDYILWWGTQGREDLSQRAFEMVAVLDGSE